MDEQKICAVLDWPQPHTVRTVHAILKLTYYCCRFIKNFGAIAEPLSKLLRKTDSGGRQRPLRRSPLIVKCDASGSGIGTVLHQGVGPVTFFSRPMVSWHTKLVKYECELIGLVQVIRH
jgi:hypothetical protein